MQRKRCVWVTPHASAYPRNGGLIRTLRLMQGLAAECDLHIVVVGGRRELADLRAVSGASLVTIVPREHGPVRVRLAALRSASTLAAARARSEAVGNILLSERALGASVVLEHLATAQYAAAAGECVLSLHDVPSQILTELPLPRNPRQLIERAWDRTATRRAERHQPRDIALVTVSDADARYFGPRAVVVPNGTDVPADPPGIPALGPTLFIGGMQYEPNRHAVEWWSREIGPRLAPSGMNNLTVIGPGTEALRLPHVAGIGEVDDLGAHLASASLIAIPLLHGGGTRLKLLEALAWNRPVVTTSKGAEGIAVQHEAHALVADSPDAFAKAVTIALTDSEVAARIAAAGRQLAVQFAWPAVAARFAELVLASPRMDS